MSSPIVDHQLTAIEIMAGTPPGGGQDRAARALAAAISETPSGTEATVRNIVGRGGGVAWESLTQHPGDGSHVAISSPTLVTNSLLDPREVELDGLTHVAILCVEPLVFVVDSGDSIENMDDVLTRLAGNAVDVAIATALGNVNHLSVAAVASHAGIAPADLDVTAFDSARVAVQAVLDGQAMLAVVSAASAIDATAAEQVRPIAVSAPSRARPPFDEVPLLAESGIDCTLSTWRGVVGPPDMDENSIERLESLLAAATKTRAWSQANDRYAWVPSFATHEAATRFVERERDHASRALTELGMIDG